MVVSQATSTIEKLQDKEHQTIQQTKQRLMNDVELTTRIITDRIVSFFRIRPIKKGKLSKGTELGYKARIDETESGFVTGYELYEDNRPTMICTSPPQKPRQNDLEKHQVQ